MLGDSSTAFLRSASHWDSSCAYMFFIREWTNLQKKRELPLQKTTLTGGPQKSIPNGIPRLQKKFGSNTLLIFEIVLFSFLATGPRTGP